MPDTCEVSNQNMWKDRKDTSKNTRQINGRENFSIGHHQMKRKIKACTECEHMCSEYRTRTETIVQYGYQERRDSNWRQTSDL